MAVACSLWCTIRGTLQVLPKLRDGNKGGTVDASRLPLERKACAPHSRGL
jgi:hypothetical protein